MRSVRSPVAARIPPALGRSGRREVSISRLAAPVSRTRRRDRASVGLTSRATYGGDGNLERERERAPRRNPGRAPPADFSAADTWDDSLEWPRSPAEPPPSYDRRESERDASPSGSGRQPPNDEEEFGARGERRESRYGAREDFGYDDWAASEPRGAYDEWRGSRDGRSTGPGWNPAESLPGVMGAATRAILAACSGMSDVTARALAGVFPRSVPMASLRTLAYLLWGFLFFVVFQRVISGFVLVGGLLLLAIAVAQGETSGGFGDPSNRDPRDGRAWGAAFGSRGSNFDEFRDARRRERRRRRAEDFFGAAAAAAGATPMMEWWNERAEYERDFYGYPGDDDTAGEPGGSFNDTAGDDGYNPYGFPDDGSANEARRRSYDSDGDYVDVTPPAIDWSKLADTVRRAASAEEFRVVNGGINGGINEGIKMANEAVRGFQGAFEGAGGAGEAGFSFSDATAPTGGGGPSAKEPVDDGLDDDASGPSSGDPTIVDVEARAVPFDEWFSRGSTDESDRGFPLTSDDAAAGTPSSFSSSSSPPPPPREGRAAYRDPPFRWTAGTYRDPNASAREGPRGEGRNERAERRAEGRNERAERRAEWGYGAFGRDVGAPPGSDRGGAGRNRWREFMTGRFYGEFQEDLIAARFDVGGGVAVEEEEDEKRGATGERGANLDDDDDRGAGAVR